MTAINYGQTYEFEGLGTFAMPLPNAGDYIVNGKIACPVPTGSGQSAVLPVVKLNATTKLTGTAGDQGFYVKVTGASAGDSINVTLTSAAGVDAGLNVIKTQIAISQDF